MLAIKKGNSDHAEEMRREMAALRSTVESLALEVSAMNERGHLRL